MALERPRERPEALGYTAEPVTSTPLSSRGLGRRILSPETRVRIPVAVPPDLALDRRLRRLWVGRGEVLGEVLQVSVHPDAGRYAKRQRQAGRPSPPASYCVGDVTVDTSWVGIRLSRVR
jgi:hypothetical protein